MIQSLEGRVARALAEGNSRVRGFPPDLIKAATRKLAMLEAAEKLEDLRTPPGNKLHPLKGDREGFHAIRINDQWRIVFRWTDAGPEAVEIVDYH